MVDLPPAALAFRERVLNAIIPISPRQQTLADEVLIVRSADPMEEYSSGEEEEHEEARDRTRFGDL